MAAIITISVQELLRVSSGFESDIKWLQFIIVLTKVNVWKQEQNRSFQLHHLPLNFNKSLALAIS
jgi:hypothetical protein